MRIDRWRTSTSVYGSGRPPSPGPMVRFRTDRDTASRRRPANLDSRPVGMLTATGCPYRPAPCASVPPARAARRPRGRRAGARPTSWAGRSGRADDHLPRRHPAVRGGDRGGRRGVEPSGADVRLKEVASARRAALRIVDGGEGGPSGVASLGYVGRRNLFSMTVAGIPISGDVRCGDRVPVPEQGPAPREVRLRRADGAAPGGAVGARRCVDAQRDGDRGRPRVRARARAPPREEHVRGDELPARAGLPEAGRHSGRSGAASSRRTTSRARSAATAAARSALGDGVLRPVPPPPAPLALTAGMDADGFIAAELDAGAGRRRPPWWPSGATRAPRTAASHLRRHVLPRPYRGRRAATA